MYIILIIEVCTLCNNNNMKLVFQLPSSAIFLNQYVKSGYYYYYYYYYYLMDKNVITINYIIIKVNRPLASRGVHILFLPKRYPNYS